MVVVRQPIMKLHGQHPLKLSHPRHPRSNRDDCSHTARRHFHSFNTLYTSSQSPIDELKRPLYLHLVTHPTSSLQTWPAQPSSTRMRRQRFSLPPQLQLNLYTMTRHDYIHMSTRSSSCRSSHTASAPLSQTPSPRCSAPSLYLPSCK